MLFSINELSARVALTSKSQLGWTDTIIDESWMRDATGVALTTPMHVCFCEAASGSSHCFKKTGAVPVSNRSRSTLPTQPLACRLMLEPFATAFMPYVPQ